MSPLNSWSVSWTDVSASRDLSRVSPDSSPEAINESLILFSKYNGPVKNECEIRSDTRRSEVQDVHYRQSPYRLTIDKLPFRTSATFVWSLPDPDGSSSRCTYHGNRDVFVVRDRRPSYLSDHWFIDVYRAVDASSERICSVHLFIRHIDSWLLLPWEA